MKWLRISGWILSVTNAPSQGAGMWVVGHRSCPLQGLVVPVVLFLLMLWSQPSSAQVKVPLYFNAGAAKTTSGQTTHPLLDGAVVVIPWSETELTDGVFDWSFIDGRVAAWAAGGKKVLIKIAPYSQTPIEGDPEGDNDWTPRWLYDAGVPRITFAGGGRANGETVSVPKVWDPLFYPYYLEFVSQVVQRFGADTRVGGFIIGIGHIGNLTAQPSEGGTAAFQAAGWTVAVWEQHAKFLIKYAAQFVKTKPVYIVFTPRFLRDVEVIDNLDAAKRIATSAATRGISIIFSGLDADLTAFATTGITEIVAHLGSLTLRSGFSMGFTDDWPLWSETGERGRDVNGLGTELQEAVDVRASIGGKYPLFYVFQQPETEASNITSSDFNQAVYDVVVEFLYP